MADDHPWLSYFDDVDETNPYRGFVSDIEDINDVVREFSYHTSTTYTVTRCTKNFGHFSLEQSSAGEHSVRFKDEGKVGQRCTIPSNGAPFMIVGLKLMECHQGPQHRTKVSKIPCDTQYWREVKSAELRNDFFSPCYEEIQKRKIIYIGLPQEKDHQNHILGIVSITY
ncbi:uncharacterized protein [Argopecten irradians]|uniref:uncharacterized protein n=1 Tax=Argopecten irradians TaxID=31199 RepID=UPI00371F5FD3